MAMQYDVNSATAAANATTTIFANAARIKGILINYTAAATLTINDGTGGTAKFTYTAPAGAAGSVYVAIPGEGSSHSLIIPYCSSWSNILTICSFNAYGTGLYC